MTRLLVSFLCACFLCACTSTQQPLTSADDYWHLPVNEIIQKANSGDPLAQYILASLHSMGGNGPVHNKEIARSWREKSIAGLEPLAAQGQAEAQFLLGEIYVRGMDGIPSDIERGMAYYEQAATQGHLQAQLQLARAYQSSNRYGVEPDEERVRYWQQQALPGIIQQAQQGNARMQNRLASFYENGTDGLEQDLQQAHDWRQKAMQGFRNELAASYSGPQPLRITAPLLLSLYYFEPNENELSGLDQFNDLVKAYTTSTLLVERFDILQELQQNIADLLSIDEAKFEHAQQLAEQCLKQLTDACY